MIIGGGPCISWRETDNARPYCAKNTVEAHRDALLTIFSKIPFERLSSPKAGLFFNIERRSWSCRVIGIFLLFQLLVQDAETRKRRRRMRSPHARRVAERHTSIGWHQIEFVRPGKRVGARIGRRGGMLSEFCVLHRVLRTVQGCCGSIAGHRWRSPGSRCPKKGAVR
jgi:hypothetical protein